MSKIFACFFPYSKISPSTSDDLPNQAFLSAPSKNISICNLSYHHVDSVTTKTLQKRIQKLENEKEALVEMMIYQHQDSKKRSSKIVLDGLKVKKTPKKSPKTSGGNYYSSAKFQQSIRKQPSECIDGNDSDSHIYMSID